MDLFMIFSSGHLGCQEAPKRRQWHAWHGSKGAGLGAMRTLTLSRWDVSIGGFCFWGLWLPSYCIWIFFEERELNKMYDILRSWFWKFGLIWVAQLKIMMCVSFWVKKSRLPWVTPFSKMASHKRTKLNQLRGASFRAPRILKNS